MEEPLLEAVYYASPFPRTQTALTYLALVFDRIHFPHVYIPVDGYDPAWLEAEATRIERLPTRGIGGSDLVQMLRFAQHAKTFEGFCKLTGQVGVMGGDDPEATTLVKQLDIAIFGPPKPGFTPIHPGGFSKSLGPDGHSPAMNYPGALHYPAHALLYSAREGVPLFNDVLGLPIPEPRHDAYKNNVKALSAIAAMQCVAMALPHVKPLPPERIVEMRAEFQPYLIPFRRAVLRLAGELNSAISSDAEYGEVEAAAKALVETEVRPQLLELKDALEKPSSDLLDTAYGAAKKTPQLVTSYLTMPLTATIAQVLIGIGGYLMKRREAQASKEALARSPYYYLLRVAKLKE